MKYSEKLSELQHQLSVTKSPYRKRDLLKAIKRTEKKLRIEKTQMRKVGDNIYISNG